jgi:hypothetical protein
MIEENNEVRTLNLLSPLDLRSKLQEMVETDLLGPAQGNEEELLESPRNRYLVGMLAPKGEPIPVDENDELALDGEQEQDEGSAEGKPAPLASMMPSSIGMTFSVSKEVSSIQIQARWGHYNRTRSEVITDDKGEPKLVWQRKQVDITSDPIQLVEGQLSPWSPDLEYPEVEIRGIIRDKDDAWTISLFLVNGQEEPKRLRDEAWVFQPELHVFHPERLPVFIKRQVMDNRVVHDVEDRRMEMNYRRHLEFVSGHGVGTHATVEDDVWDRAIEVETKVIPSHEVLRMEAPDPQQMPGMAGLELDMKVLSTLEKDTLTKALIPLVTAYDLWIGDQENQTSDDLLPYKVDAKFALQLCRQNLERIRQGILLLGQDENALKAFRFANRVMADQRIRTIFSRLERQGKKPELNDIDIPRNRSWRPFQIAFLLLNLAEMVDPAHPLRSNPDDALVDLLWFPTGGGKTEAYLGLTAFTLAIRRLQKNPNWPDGQSGVAVLMRYTLRLFTLQQFQRAASLICACELVRQEDPQTWGDEPFRIGLWVGEKSAPNRTQDAKKEIDVRRSQTSALYASLKGTVAQLTHCPWCGKPIDPGQNIVVELFNKGRGRTIQYCSDPLGECPFSQRQSPDEGLPIVVVDEELYRLLPSLVIATVDKFAQMPWKGETQMLFGRVTGKCPRHGFRSPDVEDADSHHKLGRFSAVSTEKRSPLRPPDLIIQDELHLISGPLGTLVGLYETAVDYLCEWQAGDTKVKPKIIASTATIRRAQNQVHNLYTRKVNIFPPSGLNTEDNFFSKQIPSTEKTPGRLYIGICSAGLRIKNALLGVYFAYMAAAQTLFDEYGANVDPWMTTIGYFNAMRELGGMRRIVEDSLGTMLRNADRRGFNKRFIYQESIEELNSRRSGVDIPQILSRLENRFGVKGDEKGGDKKHPSQPLDIVMCTNMISVGVDIDRLGLMIVAGQPKATAEYIQASSRVGRSFPGIVCTVYNWARPRDLSHYERFEHYHDTFYENVEALSVTPFSPRALDRGLTGTMVAMVRLQNEKLNSDKSAKDFKKDTPEFTAIVDAVKERAARVTENNDSVKLVEDMLSIRADYWQSQTNKVSAELTYKSAKNISVPLLTKPQSKKRGLYTCLNSLRDVEPNSQLMLYVGNKDEEEVEEETHE